MKKSVLSPRTEDPQDLPEQLVIPNPPTILPHKTREALYEPPFVI